jgi:phosphomannomutase
VTQNNKFIFDVDGTLTPSRRNMNAEFQRLFLEFVYDNPVYLVTGSDYPKTVEQLGVSICENVERVYNCGGNDVWEGGVNIRTNEWTLPEDAQEWLNGQLTASAFSIRTGLHFEHRPGMCNFSVVGRNATLEERAKYVKWDTEYNERVVIAHNFNLLFPDIEARPGGETGIDVAPKGYDKSQILVDFDTSDFIVFFGDRMDDGGNDAPLANALFKSYQGTNHWIKSWEDTRRILNENYANWS